MPKRLLTYLVELAEERARIARELHDGIAQELAAIGYCLDAEIGRSDTSLASRKSLRQIREQITALNSTVRNEIYLLRDPRTLSPQEKLLQSLSAMDIEFSISGILPNTDTGVDLFKTLQELTRNSIEHARASHVEILIELEKITFQNDGEAKEIAPAIGLGLVGLKERLNNIGWRINHTKGYSHVELSKDS